MTRVPGANGRTEAGPPHLLEHVFAVLLVALPAAVGRRDGPAMRETLREQVADAEGRLARWRVAARAVRRLPGVIVAEWLEQLGIGRDPLGGPPTRTTGRGGMLQSLTRNLAYAVRSLRGAPTFSLATILLVGLGVGTVTTAFTIVDDVLLRPLPFPDESRLTYMTNGSHNGETLRRLDGVEAFELWTATSVASVNLTRLDGEPLRLRRLETTPSFFTMFGATPHLGRLLVDADRDDIDIVVVSHAFWRDVLGSDPEAVGTTLQIDDQPIEIVGVLAPGWSQPNMVYGDDVQLIRPLHWSNPGLQSSGYHAHSVSALLEPEVSIEQADQQLDVIALAVAGSDPEYYADEVPDWPLQTLQERTVQDVRSGLLMLLGAVGLLMLVACANVAHLFMARGLARNREMSIRRALGARTGNILGQLSVESVTVGVAGGLVGLLLAWGGLAAFETWTVELPRGTQISLDVGVFVACIALATFTALVFGLVPGLRALGNDVQVGLHGAGRGITGSRAVHALRSGLVVFEVAISLVLVASAGLLMRSFLAVTAIDPGVEAEDVWVLRLNPTGVEDPDQYRTRMDALRSSLLSVPGIETVTYGIEAPFEHVGGDQCCWSTRMRPPDEPEAEQIRVNLHPVSDGHFETYRTEIVAGREWTRAGASADPREAVVSEQLAVRLFGSADAAVGRELPELAGGVIVAGVAEATRHYGLDQRHDYAVYLPIDGLPFPISRVTFALRAGDAGTSLGGAARQAIWSEEPALPVPAIEGLEDWISQSSAARRLGSMLFGAFGMVALLLAAAGIYGTLLYAVGQRRQELGIRLALGADRSRIQVDVIRRGLVNAALGVALGGLAAWFVGRLLEAFLFGIEATDPLALSGAAAVLFGTALVASWIPAYRASRTDPLETLRTE